MQRLSGIVVSGLVRAVFVRIVVSNINNGLDTHVQAFYMLVSQTKNDEVLYRGIQMSRMDA